MFLPPCATIPTRQNRSWPSCFTEATVDSSIRLLQEKMKILRSGFSKADYCQVSDGQKNFIPENKATPLKAII
jgi:hypothetical protein